MFVISAQGCDRRKLQAVHEQAVTMDILDPDSDSIRTCTYVEEAGELHKIVKEVAASRGQNAGELLARFNTIVRDHIQ